MLSSSAYGTQNSERIQIGRRFSIPYRVVDIHLFIAFVEILHFHVLVY